MGNRLALIAASLALLAAVFYLRDELPWFRSSPEVATQPPTLDDTRSDGIGGEQAQLEQEAHEYIETLTAPTPKPVDVAKADHFLRGEQMLGFAEQKEVELMTPRDLLADPSMSPTQPITLVKEIEQAEILSPEKLLAQAGGDLERRIRVLRGGQVEEITVGEALERYAHDPHTPITVITKEDYYEKTTPQELSQNPSYPADSPVRVIRKPYRLDSAQVSELVLDQQQDEQEALFYVRSVRAGDSQGLWGIIHDGLLHNFARGLAIRRGEEINSYQVEIPRHADERLEDHSSSFLGRIIHEKVRQSYVYNYRQHRMGRNPDRIEPGQEIVIVQFSHDELVTIYKHFVARFG
jgi:hypothetical protein